MYVLFIFLALLGIVNSFHMINTGLMRTKRSLNMVSVTVDGKTFECKPKQPLRKVMQDNKVEVYGFGGKINNCGGAGICGKCAVKVLDGDKNLSPPSKNEINTLNGKDQKGIRLSCAAKIQKGDVKIKSKAA